MDPLALVFTPGAAVIVAALLMPIGLALHRRQLQRGHRANVEQRCGWCATHFDDDVDSSPYVIEGVYVCGPCASRQRKKLFVFLPLLLLLVVTAGVSSVTGVILGGMEVGWYMNSRLIPLFASVAGLGLLTWGAIKSMKSANFRSLNPAAEPDSVVEGSSDRSRLTTGV